MTFFWLIIALMMLFAIGLVLYPLLNIRSKDQDLKQINVNLYRQQLQELNQDSRAGIMTAAMYQTMKAELEKTLLDNTDTIATSFSNKTNISLAIILVLLIPTFSLALYHYLGDSKSLSTVLQINAESKQWYDLGEHALQQKNIIVAHKAFTKAYNLNSNNPDIMLKYAESDFLIHHHLSHAGKQALDKVLQLEPRNVNAINLLAVSAYHQKNYREARKYWIELLHILPDGSQDQQTVLQMMTKMVSNRTGSFQ